MKAAHITRAAILLAAACLSPIAPLNAQTALAAAEPDAARLALAKEVVAIAFPEQGRETMFASLIDPMVTQIRAGMFANTEIAQDAGAMAIVNSHLDKILVMVRSDLTQNMPGLFEAITRAYARQFTTQELSELLAFLSTPSGTKFIQRSPQIMADPDIAGWNQAYMTRTMAKVRDFQSPLRDELTNYLRKRK